GPELFHRNERGERTDDDCLLLRLATIGRSHCGRFQRGDNARGLEGHRHSLLEADQRKNKADRQEHVDHDAPHIEKERADLVRTKAKSSDDRGERTEADRRREKEIRDHHEDLREVGKMDVTGPVLEIGIGTQRHRGVGHRRWRQHPTVQFIKWHPRLNSHDYIAVSEQESVEDEQRYRVLLPIQIASVESILEPLEEAWSFVLAIHDPGEITAEWNSKQSGC